MSAQASATIVFPVPIDFSGQMGGTSPQQMQTMMQSAVALASGEKAKQLAAASNEDALPQTGKRAQGQGDAQSEDDQLVPARRR